MSSSFARKTDAKKDSTHFSNQNTLKIVYFSGIRVPKSQIRALEMNRVRPIDRVKVCHVAACDCVGARSAFGARQLTAPATWRTRIGPAQCTRGVRSTFGATAFDWTRGGHRGIRAHRGFALRGKWVSSAETPCFRAPETSVSSSL